MESSRDWISSGESDSDAADEASKWLAAAEAVFGRISADMNPSERSMEQLTERFESEQYLVPIRTYFLFLKKAVELRPNCSPALHKLALAHLNGYGIRKSRPEALRLIRLAADFGTPDQLWEMSWNIKHETAGNRSWPEGMREVERMCRLGAVQGHEGCQHALAEMYADGSCGLPQDFELAKYWYTKSAEKGQFPPAEYFLKNFRKKNAGRSE